MGAAEPPVSGRAGRSPVAGGWIARTEGRHRLLAPVLELELIGERRPAKKHEVIIGCPSIIAFDELAMHFEEVTTDVPVSGWLDHPSDAFDAHNRPPWHL